MVDIRMKIMVFKISLSDPVLWLLVLIFCFSQMSIMLPMNTFLAYYTILCRQLHLCIRQFTKDITAVPDSDYGKVLRDYISIRTFVSKIEDELSVFVFTASLYNACSMYFGMTVILHPEEFMSTIQSLSVGCLFIASSVAYLGLALSGSLVHEAASDLCLKAHEILSRKPEVNSFQQRFLSIVEKNLHVTVWKILPITRSFILATMGTVFTYCLLLDNIRTLKDIKIVSHPMVVGGDILLFTAFHHVTHEQFCGLLYDLMQSVATMYATYHNFS
ncbi:hypothetical protein AVEN_49614-1 [Araneus ventricosus]|uniref:Gustatory receptor n=1 Tax=Araneus ventricosus TaxID=182803 RepID=A0A4Y2QJB7_ARAVE|nr:hypothetical protein AVEN_205093-1 [Araneus ventricosus]GBN63512.1 hypothetical protein AVEN_49614-1 [Araneus ventricosus]